MKKMKYIFSRIFSLNFNGLVEKIDLVKKNNNKNKFIILCDMIWCAIKYGAGYNDYYCFGMYDMNKRQRSTILTRSKNNSYVALLNNKEQWHFFDNKNEFNFLFSKYLKRKWLFIKNDFEDFNIFIKDIDVIIAKPNNDSGGHGIQKLYKKDFKDSKVFYDYLIANNLLLIEEVVEQHDVLAKVNPSSVNTIRFITIFKNNKINFVTSFLRIGAGGSFVDNTCSGGMLTMIDLDKGITLYDAVDVDLNVFKVHPSTNVKIKGIKIPYFNEAKLMVEEMATLVKGVKYVAWDIAITNDGPLAIEGNPYPGYYYQFPLFCPDKIGILPEFQKIMKK